MTYAVPYKDLSSYLSSTDEFQNSKVLIPDSKYKLSDEFMEHNQRSSNSTNDDSLEETEILNDTVSKNEESKYSITISKCKIEVNNPKSGSKIIEKLGHEYLENQQKLLSHGKSTMIFHKRTFMKSKKITGFSGYEECMKLLEANLGITPDLEEDSKAELEPENTPESQHETTDYNEESSDGEHREIASEHRVEICENFDSRTKSMLGDKPDNEPYPEL